MSQGIDPGWSRRAHDVLVHEMPISEVIQPETDIAVARRPGRRRDRDEHQDRPRALAGERRSGDYDFICNDTPPSPAC
jgi:hypothetical protein